MILPPVRHASCRRGAGNEGRSRKFERNASHGGSKFSRMRAPPPPAAIGMHDIPQEPAREPPSRAGSWGMPCIPIAAGEAALSFC